jgi:hypothetical protein
MAVSTQLGIRVAELLTIPATSAASHVRNLREAGLLSKTGRGITAAQMTTRDAAHVLIAANASMNVKDSVGTVNEFTKLSSKYGQPTIRLPRYAELKPDHSFVDALTALLDTVVHDEFKSPSEFDFKVRMFGPVARAEIEWADKQSNSLAASTAEYVAPAVLWSRSKSRRKTPTAWNDRETRSTFTEITILQIGALIGGQLP